MKSHNKKRNTGLLYEFLVNYISQGIVDGDDRKSAVGLRILKKHFKVGTALHKEFRLINSLRKTTVSSEQIAMSILNEAKSAVRQHSAAELDRQKSLLIKDINYIIKDDTFFEQNVPDYKYLATLQTLFNDWRSQSPDLSRVATFEEQLVKKLLEGKASPAQESTCSQHSPGEVRYLLGIMMKKLNERFSTTLTNEQRALMKAYAFSTVSDDQRVVTAKMQEIKENVLAVIDSLTEQQYIAEKLSKVKQQLLAEDVSTVDDAAMARFMLYLKLSTELTADD